MGSSSSAKSGSYRRSVDLLRFVACFGIVWDHARAPYADIGYLSLAIFLVLTSFLAVGSFERSNGANFWLSRAQRIALPWLFWCVVFRVLHEWFHDEPGLAPILTEPGSLLIGPYIHLWFLPFVMIFLVLIPTISTQIQTRLGLIIACVLLGLISVPFGLLHAEAGLVGWFVAEASIPQPLPQWFFSLPLFLYGGISAAAHRMGESHIPVLAAAAISAVMTLLVPDFASMQMILAALVFEMVWRIRINGTWPTTLAGAAFGIYLMHPIFMLAAFKLFGADVNRSFGALVAFFGAWAATVVLQRTPLSRFV